MAVTFMNLLINSRTSETAIPLCEKFLCWLSSISSVLNEVWFLDTVAVVFFFLGKFYDHRRKGTIVFSSKTPQKGYLCVSWHEQLNTETEFNNKLLFFLFRFKTEFPTTYKT